MYKQSVKQPEYRFNTYNNTMGQLRKRFATRAKLIKSEYNHPIQRLN